MEPEIYTEYLITLVSERPVVWDKSLEQYKSRARTTEAWQEICCHLFPDFENMTERDQQLYAKHAMKKWRNIKDQWLKSIKKSKGEGKSGFGVKKTRKYIFHEQLSFLQKCTLQYMRYTGSSFDDDSDVLSESSPNLYQEVTVNATDRLAAPVLTGPTLKRNKMDIERQIMESSYSEDRHLFFFKGLIPSLGELTEDETLQFQAGTIGLLQDIKRARADPTLLHPQTTFGYGPTHHIVYGQNSYGLDPNSNWNMSKMQTAPHRHQQHLTPSPAEPAASDISDMSDTVTFKRRKTRRKLRVLTAPTDPLA